MSTPPTTARVELPEWIDPAQVPADLFEWPLERQQMYVQMMAHMREGFRAQDEAADARRELPQPPKADSRRLAYSSLYGDRDLLERPLTDEERFEFEALVAQATAGETRLPVYNQPVTLLTLSETAEQLGISVTGVRRLIRAHRLHMIRLGRTVRVRSDLVWALIHRPDLEAGVYTMGPAYRYTCESDAQHLGVPVDEVARMFRVHPRTVFRWADRGRATGMMRIIGHGDEAMVTARALSSIRVPFQSEQLRPVHPDGLRGFSREAKRAAAEVERRTRDHIDFSEARRTDILIEGISGARLYTYPEIARMLNISVSGARKAVARAGISHSIIGGAARVHGDDVMYLWRSRMEGYNRRHGIDEHIPDPRPSLLPLSEVAAKLGVTVRTVRRRIAAGALKGVIRSGKLWVRRADMVIYTDGAGRAEQVRIEKAKAKKRDERRGADLELEHIIAFLKWAKWDSPEVDTNLLLHTRASAANYAQCRQTVIEQLVREGLIPARRSGRDLQIRLVDLVAAGVFSAKVARMCPGLRIEDEHARHNVRSEFLSFEQVAEVVERPVSEVRRLVEAGVLRGVKFGRVHRLHMSEVSGPGLAMFKEIAPPYEKLKYRRMRWEMTVNEAANELGLSERSVVRWMRKGALLGYYAVRQKNKQLPSGIWAKVDVPVNRNGMLLQRKHVLAARRLRQARGMLPRDVIEVTQERVDSGNLPELQPWQEFRIVEGERL